jgi:cytochrome c-type biogenesis protein CcmH
MIVFWIAAALLSAATAALIVYYSGREPQTVTVDPAAAVYRRQLDEIDEMASRGLIAEDERSAAHAEAARRLLGAGEAISEAPTSKRVQLAILGAAIVAAIAAMVVYLFIGAPGQPDMPFKARAAQWDKQLDADPSQLDVERLAVVLKGRYAKDGKPETLYYLALMQVQSGQVQLGIHNLRKVAEQAPNQPDVWAKLGEALTLASPDQSVTPEAAVAFNKAIALDPKQVRPRFFLGQARIEAGDKEAGLAQWKALLAELPPGSPEGQAITSEIARVEGGGQRAAGNPQAAMIQQMVSGLAEKLKQNPNDAPGWARLIRSYAVLGDTAKMNAALEEARRIFKDRPSERAAIEAAADKPQ